MPDKAILIVDDEAIILLSIKQSLQLRFGRRFRYETAMDAQSGLACIEELEAEGIEVVVVISDWLMPGMKGDEFLKTVERKNPSIQLVMITGHADESEIEKLCVNINMKACLRKPFNTEKLFEIIETAVEDFSKTE